MDMVTLNNDEICLFLKIDLNRCIKAVEQFINFNIKVFNEQ